MTWPIIATHKATYYRNFGNTINEEVRIGAFSSPVSPQTFVRATLDEERVTVNITVNTKNAQPYHLAWADTEEFVRDCRDAREAIDKASDLAHRTVLARWHNKLDSKYSEDVAFNELRREVGIRIRKHYDGNDQTKLDAKKIKEEFIPEREKDERLIKKTVEDVAKAQKMTGITRVNATLVDQELIEKFRDALDGSKHHINDLYYTTGLQTASMRLLEAIDKDKEAK